MHTPKSLKYRNFCIMFSYKNKKYILTCIFCFNNQFIKVTRNGQYFKNFKKNILFYFNIGDYEHIRKTYS
jgi:hypothetical protein